jgi:hypothetical protein
MHPLREENPQKDCVIQFFLLLNPTLVSNHYGSLHYLFVEVFVFVRFNPPLDLIDISIFISEWSVVTFLHGLAATDITIFLPCAQFHRLKSKVTLFRTSAFHFSQTAAIANMRDDSCDRFVLMDQIHKI